MARTQTTNHSTPILDQALGSRLATVGDTDVDARAPRDVRTDDEP